MISRRHFLQLAGVAALSATAGCAARSAQSAPVAAPTAALPTDVDYLLTTREVEWELAPGKVVRAWSYNGRVPGETVRVLEGERVRIGLRNELPEVTTVHWHGIDVPTTMDGVPELSQAAVQPGGTFVYEFNAQPAGTRWYHTHVNSAEQQDRGLSAPFIIDPRSDDLAVDREYTLLLDDWATAQGISDGFSWRGMMGGMMSASRPRYDTFTINGKASPATEPLPVTAGDRVRLRLINASTDQTFVIGLVGHQLEVTHTDGNPLRSPVAVDALPIAPAERYDVTFTADNPGRWPLHALHSGHLAGGLQTLVTYKGVASSTPAQIPQPSNRLRFWTYAMGQGTDFLPAAVEAGRSYEFTLSGGMMMSRNRWTMNGRVYPDTPRMHAALGQLVRVHLANMSMESHPFHLHGQSFRVLGLNGRALSVPLIKDTVDIAGHMGSVDIEFVAHNPGDWLFHCHKPLHMDGGMSTVLQIA